MGRFSTRPRRGLQFSSRGSVMDVYPYRRRHRFAERFTATENQEI